MGPHVAELVHYVGAGGPDGEPACLAAMVTDLYGGTTVDLTVFPPAQLLMVERVDHSDAITEHTWHRADSCA
jgi:hypothetical protein